MIIKFKKLYENAITPAYAKEGDAALDLTANSMSIKDEYWEYGTGLSFEIPEGYVGLLFPRSSISERGLMLCNSVGVLDSGYRGEVSFRFTGSGNRTPYKLGERIGQLIVLPYPQITLVEGTLNPSARGTGGYGSTGK